MDKKILGSFFQNVSMPVIVITDEEQPKVVYENQQAFLLFNPFGVNDDEELLQSDVLPLPEEDYQEIISFLKESGTITGFMTRVPTAHGQGIPIMLSASIISLDCEDLIAFYISQEKGSLDEEKEDIASGLKNILSIAYKTTNIEEAINNILAFAGAYVNVSRSYIFESVSSLLTSNTYEWCALGTKPAIQLLQNLPKAEYSYDDIIERGMTITNDIREMSSEDRAILEPQGIKALAIIPIYYVGDPLGYVGFDDCEKYRVWSRREINFLKEVADILGSVIVQRNTQKSLKYSLDMFETITDNTDTLIYVNDIQTYELLFANHNVEASIGVRDETIIGKPCYETVQQGMNGPCEFCPMQKMIDDNGKIINNYYRWEFKNTITGKWYLIRDSIIKWIDGRDVHIETATEITNRKEYESHLEYIASTDIMTGAYTREWGIKTLTNILQAKKSPENCLVFIDLDSLKEVNDKFGHADGDFMIIKTIEIVSANLRKSDMICRWGGDEFVLVVRGSVADTEVALHNITTMLEAYNAKNEIPFKLAFSYGIAEIFPDKHCTIEDIISSADKKMYEQKKLKNSQKP